MERVGLRPFLSARGGIGYHFSMSTWLLAASIAILVATVPMAWVYRILADLPRPIVLSHRRWPPWANFALIGAVTFNVALFARAGYYGAPRPPSSVGLHFLVAAVVYAFGFVMLLRQFSGLYPEYFVTTGRTGVSMRKALYRNVIGIRTLSESRGETRLGLEMRGGEILPLDLPTRHLPALAERIKESQPKL